MKIEPFYGKSITIRFEIVIRYSPVEGNMVVLNNMSCVAVQVIITHHAGIRKYY